MRKMDSLGLSECRYQAKLFEASIDNTECSSKIFIRRFMNSDVAFRMDKNGIMFEALDIHDAIDEVEEQYGVSSYGVDQFTREELHWIGYIYRYWAYISGKSSKQIYKIAKPEYLRKLYFPYHSLDPYQAIERIAEEQGESLENDYGDIAKGVIILRKVRNKSKMTGENK
ncbi:hypothetical protein [Pseudobutyrivibrio xylanivorans]|uniref:Uncharacterized protein n=1 Tax=Pseudobutyrivibrio xylanivorans DSM 14809 TaxID=1123012 RepID=A0A1M6GWE5_PSEXY|nr:hypothetical protein [Pseudobutyrivibrio xylanivorans]SHJ14237.1 hypothetical protein SAMN02745725_01848 [Pseudobutyrivibrio xylanivorans DSM 14809]